MTTAQPAVPSGLLVVDRYVRPGGRVAAEHVHPAITGAFTVVRRDLQVRHNGHELRVGPGDRTLVPPGVAHDFWNASDRETRVVVEIQPGRRFEQMIRQTFLAAQDGRTDSKGRPFPLPGAMLLRAPAAAVARTGNRAQTSSGMVTWR
jgi:hypothetical protein